MSRAWQALNSDLEIYTSKVGSVPLAIYSAEQLKELQIEARRSICSAISLLGTRITDYDLGLVASTDSRNFTTYTWTDADWVDGMSQKLAREWRVQRIATHSDISTLLTILVQTSMDYQDTASNATFPVSERPLRDPAFGSRVIRGVSVPLVDGISTPEHGIELAIVDKPYTQSQPAPAEPADRPVSSGPADPLEDAHLAQRLHPQIISQVMQSLMSLSIAYTDAVLSIFTRFFLETVPRECHATIIQDELDSSALNEYLCRALSDQIDDATAAIALRVQFADAQMRAMNMLITRCFSASLEKRTGVASNRMPRSQTIDPLRHALLPLHFASQAPGTLYHTSINVASMGAYNGPSLAKHGQPVRMNASNADATSTHLSGSRERVYEKRHNKKVNPAASSASGPQKSREEPLERTEDDSVA